MNSLTSNKYILASKDFLDSESILAKFTFLILVIIVFVILLKIGINLLSYFLTPSVSPHLINGMISGKNSQLIFSQDPNSGSSVPILRSNNANNGIEFSWSVWLFIEDLVPTTQYKHIFSKGNDSLQSNGLIYPNNCPGLYINPDTNALTVIMNTFYVSDHEIVVTDIPLNKWFNVIIRVQNKICDIYINGMIAKSHEFVGVVKQNYGDVYVGLNGGFDGNLSNLWYWDYALGTTQISNIANWGPNTKLATQNQVLMKDVNYLSLDWYMNQ
jgi:hypothetical protein